MRFWMALLWCLAGCRSQGPVSPPTASATDSLGEAPTAPPQPMAELLEAMLVSPADDGLSIADYGRVNPDCASGPIDQGDDLSRERGARFADAGSTVTLCLVEYTQGPGDDVLLYAAQFESTADTLQAWEGTFARHRERLEAHGLFAGRSGPLLFYVEAEGDALQAAQALWPTYAERLKAYVDGL